MSFKLIEFIQNVTKLNKSKLDEFQNNIKDGFDEIENGTQSIAYDNTMSGLEATTVKGAIDELASKKQNALTAGDNITIENGVISATGGGSSSVEDLTSTITDYNNKITDKSIKFIKDGNTYCLSGYISSNTFTETDVIFKIPTEYKPPIVGNFVFFGGGGSVGCLAINTTGQVYTATNATNSNWMQFTATWIKEITE